MEHLGQKLKAKPNAGFLFALLIYFLLVWLTRTENSSLLSLRKEDFVCDTVLQVLHFVSFQPPRSNFYRVAAQWVSLCVSTFSQLPHVMPLLKLFLLTGIVSSNYQWFPFSIGADKHLPQHPPVPHPTLDIARRIYSKAISKSCCWKYWIDLDHPWENPPRKISDFDTELNIL